MPTPFTPSSTITRVFYRRLVALPLLALGLGAAGLGGCHKEDVALPAPAVQPLPLAAGALVLNPTGFAPLSARLTFATARPGTTRVVVHGKHGSASDVVQELPDAGTAHVVPVLGLYPDWANEVDVVFTADNGRTVLSASLVVQTQPLPAAMPTAIAVTQAPTGPLGGALSLVSNFSSTAPRIPFVVDNFGDIRWLLDFTDHPVLRRLSYDCGISRLHNGNYFFGDKTTSQLYEVDALGAVVTSWNLPGYTFHHEALEKPDGNFLVTVNKTGSTHPDGTPTVEDFVVEIDRRTNAVRHEWDLRQLLDEGRTAVESNSEDWVHVNAVAYDPVDNTVVVSGRYQGLVKLTYDDRLVWILSPHKGWGRNRRGQNLTDFLLTPLDATGRPIADPGVALGTVNHPDFEWNWYQHSPIRLPTGEWMLFDNGTHRNFDPAPGTYSRAVAYRIDPVRMTVQQVWTYGKDRGAETFSSIVSRVQYLPQTNHVLFCPGYQVPTGGGAGGRIIEVDYASKQPVFELSVTAANGFGFHRAERTTFDAR